MAWTLCRTLALAGSFAALSAAGHLMAQTAAVDDGSQAGAKSDRVQPDLKTPPPGTPVDVDANRITYNSATRIATATGDVIMTYGGYTLVASKVVYDQVEDRLQAEGDVSLTEPGGNVLEADVAALWNRFRDGFAHHLRLLLTNDATLTAEYAERRDGVVTIYTRVTYTRCKTCLLPDGTPVWQIRSGEVTHDEVEGTIYHRDATFQFLGANVFWLPSLSHPDPTVDRRSGFLIPSFSFSDDFGLGVEVPYFWNLAPNYDVTLRPLITTDQGPLARAVWRHRLSKGQYSVDAGGIHQLDRDLDPPGDRRWRGFVRSRGDFHINDTWSWGWDATAVSDDTFMRRYKLDGRTELLSRAHLTGLQGRNYFTAQTLHFEGLLEGDDNDTFPAVLPYMRHDFTFDRPVMGGELGLDTSAYTVFRDDPLMPFATVSQAQRQSRAVVETHWERRLTGAAGQVMTPFARLRGDLYVTDDLPDATIPDGLRDEEVTARVLPTVGLDLRWPFMRSDWLGTHIVTPVAQIIASTNEEDEDRIGNEDAVQVNFDSTSLFLHDRFMGDDRFEGGTRANLGVLYTMLLPTGGFARASLGQSYHLAGGNSFIAESGLAGTSSDVVAGLALQPLENLRLSYQLRLEESSLDVHTQEIGLSADVWRVHTTLNYTDLDAEPGHGRPVDREQLWGSAAWRLGGGWSLLGAGRFDLEREEFVRTEIGFGFDCDCFAFQLFYRHDNTNDRDVDEDHSVLMRIEFKTLGSTAIGTGL